jgi:hypothetical protein
MTRPEFTYTKGVKDFDVSDPSHSQEESERYLMTVLTSTTMWYYEGPLGSDVEILANIFINRYAFIELMKECVITSDPLALIAGEKPFPFKGGIWYNGVVLLCPTNDEPIVKLFVSKPTANHAKFPPPWEI